MTTKIDEEAYPAMPGSRTVKEKRGIKFSPIKKKKQNHGITLPNNFQLLVDMEAKWYWKCCQKYLSTEGLLKDVLSKATKDPRKKLIFTPRLKKPTKP